MVFATTELDACQGADGPTALAMRDVQRFSELAVTWVLANPDPLPAPEPAYLR